MGARAFARSFICALASVAALGPGNARATESAAVASASKGSDAAEDERALRRYELAGFPIVAGNSDIGFEFGAVGTMTRFAKDVAPYRWNMDAVFALSVKSGPTGAEITQQSYQWNIDVPKAAGGSVRLNPQLLYYRTVNQLYFGLGNASSPRAPNGASARYFEFDDRQAHFRELTRIMLGGPIDLLLRTQYRFENPHVYSGSQLERDANAGVIRGVRPLSLFTVAGGFVYDTRDNEFFPLSGSYHHVGVRTTLGLPYAAGVRYGGTGGQLASYVPLGASSVLAVRALVDLEFGNVPVYDLYTGGVFYTDEMIGGSSSVRGVPDGRYSGLIKAFGNAELRALLVPFELFGQQFRVGGNLLFDTGRLWNDYSFHSRLDGSGLGLKWGAGGGLYLQWGRAAVFRLEAAYSPDAKSENPGLPLGIYVEDGVMF